ncbi:unnamed protein product [Cuscuta epithymum]|uniref:Uncharacterized protein n=1 Tax=Cuscuta epithymum TaxID=186058 RepID=A0AAV0FAH5_9ASTE|nr:unnamed protein product [Cuscuta epithymum]
MKKISIYGGVPPSPVSGNTSVNGDERQRVAAATSDRLPDLKSVMVEVEEVREAKHVAAVTNNVAALVDVAAPAAMEIAAPDMAAPDMVAPDMAAPTTEMTDGGGSKGG